MVSLTLSGVPKGQRDAVSFRNRCPAVMIYFKTMKVCYLSSLLTTVFSPNMKLLLFVPGFSAEGFLTMCSEKQGLA